MNPKVTGFKRLRLSKTTVFWPNHNKVPLRNAIFYIPFRNPIFYSYAIHPCKIRHLWAKTSHCKLSKKSYTTSSKGVNIAKDFQCTWMLEYWCYGVNLRNALSTTEVLLPGHDLPIKYLKFRLCGSNKQALLF